MAFRRPGSTQRGFTLVEMAIVVAIVALLSVAAYSISRAERRNVYLRQATSELALRVTGLRSTALSNNVTYLLVVVDAPGNDASRCGTWNASACTQYFILAAPQATWTLNAFDPGNPSANVSSSSLSPPETDYLPTGARFYVQSGYDAPPAPFDKVEVFDNRFLGSCKGRACFAVRFTTSGVAYPVMPDGTAPPYAAGFAFVLASDAELEGAGGAHRGVVVGFPSGIAKTWAY